MKMHLSRLIVQFFGCSSSQGLSNILGLTEDCQYCFHRISLYTRTAQLPTDLSPVFVDNATFWVFLTAKATRYGVFTPFTWSYFLLHLPRCDFRLVTL